MIEPRNHPPGRKEQLVPINSVTIEKYIDAGRKESKRSCFMHLNEGSSARNAAQIQSIQIYQDSAGEYFLMDKKIVKLNKVLRKLG
jgi:hypothetical protein